MSRDVTKLRALRSCRGEMFSLWKSPSLYDTTCSGSLREYPVTRVLGSSLQSQMFYFYWFLSPHSTLTFLIVFPDRHVQIQEWMDGFWGSLLLIRFVSANRHRLSGKLCVVTWYKIVIIFFEWQVSLSSVSNNLCGSITWTLKFFRKIAFILLLRNICVCLSLKSKKFLILYTKNVKTKSKICRIILIWHWL